jgi:hypothetical protein
MLYEFAEREWQAYFPDSSQQLALAHLEAGEVLYFPHLAFQLFPSEQAFLKPEYADPRSKNISYYAPQHKLWGVQQLQDEQHAELKAMLARFSDYASTLIAHLLPRYSPQLLMGRTSFRPQQVSTRKTSYRKDDKRLHVDAFPSAPNQGKRILRVFSNINPNGEARVWRLGEPFPQVAEHFLPRLKKPLPGKAALLRLLRITKSYRSLYDHYMLGLHDQMKADDVYQQQAKQTEVHFPPGSSWIVQTDQVSHAAMQGQYVLEQTFYLPVTAMQDETHAPLRILERLLGQALV